MKPTQKIELRRIVERLAALQNELEAAARTEADAALDAATLKTCGERLKRIANMDDTSTDAHCIACGFEMRGGSDVGRCPKCGSERWYKTRIAQTLA